jgi:RNase P subunit RPR2
MSNFELMRCPNCSNLKPISAHTFATYKVYIKDTVLKLVCKSCGHEQKYRYIDGGI